MVLVGPNSAVLGLFAPCWAKFWLAYCRHCASIWTQVPFHFFSFYMGTLTKDVGPRCYLKVSKIGPLWGSTGEDSRFQPSMGWLKSCNFGVTSDDPQGPLGHCWVVIC